MLRSRYNQTSKPLTDLLGRIHQLQTQDEFSKYLKRLKSQCLYLLMAILILLFFRTPSHIYNVLHGPFHLNLDEFITHWNIYSGNTSAESWNFFDKQYLQIELGEDIIDVNPEYIFRVHHYHPAYTNVSYTFHYINEPNITEVPMELLVKLPTDLEEYFHKRLPYRFELFNSDTLKCIAKQIDVDQSKIDIKQIEEIYDHNATDFHMKVITKCGILIGYLDECVNDEVYTLYSNISYVFTLKIVAFDASTSYSSYLTYIIHSLLTLWCIKIILEIFLRFIRHIFQRSTKNVSHEIKYILNMFNIDSIQSLDRLIMEAYRIGDYYDQLFLVREQYLIIFKLDLNEHNPIILRQFYEKSPFSIIDIETIVEIKYYYIFTSDHRFQNQIPLLGINIQRNEWLHNRLMNCSANYRQQEVIRANDMTRRRCRLTDYINDEEEIQRTNNNDIERIYNRVTSASPRFIAEFRLEGPKTLNTQIPETKCVICYEQFLIGDQYSTWPCAAQHMFHYQCMLEVLRKQNHCPLCRHAVEAAQLPSTYDIYNRFFVRNNIF